MGGSTGRKVGPPDGSRRGGRSLGWWVAAMALAVVLGMIWIGIERVGSVDRAVPAAPTSHGATASHNETPDPRAPGVVDEVENPNAAADVVFDLMTGEAGPLPRRITSIAAIEPEFAVSPDGTRLAFVGTTRQIYVADLDGTGLRQVTHGPSALFSSPSPAWSPDGSSIVYVADSAVARSQHVYLLDVNTGERTRITRGHDDGFGDRFWAPVFSPDGRTVVFTARGTSLRRDTLDLWTVPVSGGTPTLLMADAAFGTYSPDGTTIAFRRAAPAVDYDVWPISMGIRLADADGTVRRLGNDSGWMMAPFSVWPATRASWSPDGDRIAFVTPGLPGGRRVVLVHVATGRARRLDVGDQPVWLDEHTLIAVPEGGLS